MQTQEAATVSMNAAETLNRSVRPPWARVALLAPLLCAAATAPAHAAHHAPLHAAARHGAVAADTPEASQAGAEILKKGGNAVDAAIATALALGVVAPGGSGLGGGGFAVVWIAKEHRATMIDFREVAPHAARREMFADDKPAPGQPPRSAVGGLAVGVPGEPAGLALLHQKLGHLPLAKIVLPVVRLAQAGFQPSRRLVSESHKMSTALPADEPMRRWLVPNGRELTDASLVRRPALAATITRFGAKGRDALYSGPIAEELVATTKAHGGLLTMDDLASYQPLWRDPLVGQFRGRTIYAAPPPAGGATAIEALNFLDALPALPRGSLGSSAWFHRIAEALTHAFADRARWMGDPAFFKVPIEKLTSPAYAQSLVLRFAEDKVLPTEAYGTPAEKGSPVEPPRDHGTSHLCVIDGEGNAVALTTTINLELGAQLEAARSGVILNDQMDDFAARPGRPNEFGLVGAEANAIAAGKRPQSSMTPMLIVENGELVMCVGGSGGPTIVASSVQAVAAVFDEGVDAEGAVTMSRVYAQWLPVELRLEHDIPNDVADALAKKGHKIARTPTEGFAPAVQVLLRRGGVIEAASDPRKGGRPAVQ